MGDYQASGETVQKTTPSREDRFVPVPGLVYLRRPRAGTVLRRDGPSTDDSRPEPADTVVRDAPAVAATAPVTAPVTADTAPDTAGAGSGSGSAAAAPSDADPAAGEAVARRVAMLVGTWLEVVDGLRPVTVLRKGPFSPTVSDRLRGTLRTTGGTRTSPSRVLSVNIPPTHRDRLGFTASVVRDGRVRAVVGHLSRYSGQWRVESITLI